MSLFVCVVCVCESLTLSLCFSVFFFFTSSSSCTLATTQSQPPQIAPLFVKQLGAALSSVVYLLWVPPSTNFWKCNTGGVAAVGTAPYGCLKAQSLEQTLRFIPPHHITLAGKRRRCSNAASQCRSLPANCRGYTSTAPNSHLLCGFTNCRY